MSDAQSTGRSQTRTGRVLVTGAGGFIGSHLCEALLRAGHQVRAFVRYTSHGGSGWLRDVPAELAEGLEIFYGDIRDSRAVREAARDCQAIYHLAALIGIPYSYLAPRSYVEVNVEGTLNVLEAARDLEIPRTLVTSTSEVYGTAQYTPIDERHPLQGQSPYSASKIGADHLAESYYRSFELPVAIVRPFNTYGPRQSARAIIPTILSQALSGDSLRLGNLAPVRDLVYVEDTAAGFLALAQSDAALGVATNLATGVGVSIGELVERVRHLLGKELPVHGEAQRHRPDASEVYRLIGSAELAESRAGWRSQVDLDQGLERTLAWVADHLDAFDVQSYSV